MVTKDLFSFAATAAKTLCLVAAAATALTLASCSDDDDGSDDGNPNAGLIETASGSTLRLTSVGDFDFSYSGGQLVGIEEGNTDFTVSYSPFAITADGVVIDGENTTINLSNIRVNSSGYITSMNVKNTVSYSGGSESYSESYSGSVKCSYDDNGHLTKMTGSGSSSWTEIYDGEKDSGSGSYSVALTFSWNGDLLQNISYSDSESDNGWKWSETGTFDFVNSTSYPNTTYQHTPNTSIGVALFVYETESGILMALAYLGYFGKGPSYHPVGWEYEYEYTETEDGEGYEEEDSESGKFSYSLNSNGSVNSCYGFEGITTYFSYEGVSAAKSRASVKELPSSEEENTPLLHRRHLGRHNHHRHAQGE